MRQLTLFKSDGTRMVSSVSLAAGTYYAELTPAEFECARLGSFLLKFDATLVASVTFESTNTPELATYAAAASGWDTSPAPSPSALSTVTINASAGLASRYAIDLPFGRLRAKVVVTTAGVLEVFENNKDG